MLPIRPLKLAVLAAVPLACVAGCAGAWELESNVGALSPACCTVVADPSSGVAADGARTATIRVVLRDARKRPIANEQVQVTATGSGNRVRQVDLVTDAEGAITAQIASTHAETKTVLAVVNPGARCTLLPEAPTIEFVESTRLDTGAESHE